MAIAEKSGISNLALKIFGGDNVFNLESFFNVLSFSTDDFKESLDNYCNAVFGDTVIIYRSPVTLGLIKARLQGARMARGDVLAILDAHMEVQEKWSVYEIHLEPLLLLTENMIGNHAVYSSTQGGFCNLIIIIM